MKTVNKYGIEFAGQPRARRGWKRRLGCWLWSLVWMVLVSLALWGLFAWATGRVTGLTGVSSLTMARPASAMRLAGFGLPEWVAYGVVGTLTMSVLALIAWNAIQPKRADADEVAARWQHDVMEEGMQEPWQKELSEWFKQRDVWISAKNARQMQALAQPDHVMALPMLDSYLRRELGLRLFVTSLMEIQAICGKGVAA